MGKIEDGQYAPWGASKGEFGGPKGPQFRPHISATPRNQTDTKQHESLKTIDSRN
jgi:hypothetical protein